MNTTASKHNISWRAFKKLVNELNQDSHQRTPDRDHRASAREPFPVPIRLQRYAPDERKPHNAQDPSIVALGRNISRGGLAAVVRRMYRPEDPVYLVVDTKTTHLRLVGRIVFCRHIMGMFHEIGIEFVRRVG